MGRTRRAMAALAITTALLALAACGGDGPATRPDSQGGDRGDGRTVLAPPANGQIDGFTWALPFEAVSLDPIKSWSYPENTILATLCESVVHLTPDEPTTALDVTTQAEVMAILADLKERRGLAMLLITHDLELAAACDRTAVMYAGSIVEVQRSSELHDRPLHPYTSALVAARPSVRARLRRLPVIPGQPVAAFQAPGGCSFAPRCRYALPRCAAERPALRPLGQGLVACVRAEELRSGGLLAHGGAADHG